MSGSKSTASAKVGDAEDDRFWSGMEDRLRRLELRVAREHMARTEAERILESKSLELFAANQGLLQLNAELEERVRLRTEELDLARRSALELVESDHLTSIPSRFCFSRTLEESLERTAGNGRLIGLLLIDIDDFKLVNDTYGHGHGDILLKEIAGRLRAIARRGELVARIGGDEFAVILEASARGSLESAAERFAAAFRLPVTILGVPLQTGGSMGLAISPEHSTSGADLQRFADLALYKVKARGGGGLAVFERSLLDSYQRRQRIENEFRAAVASGGIDLSYQPILSLASGRIEAVEALARWSDSHFDEINPCVFVPLAEQCGLIREVGRTLLNKALGQTKDWVDRQLIDKVNVNVSPIELLDDGFAEDVLAALEQNQFDAGRLVLEITEGVVLRNVSLAKTVMTRLCDRGVTFALDDFGVGYSNLSSLTRLPISVLKIDRSLLLDVETDPSAQVIIRNIVALCHDLGVRAVSEGAERAGQLNFLRSIGCDSVQGFLCGRPVNAALAEAMLLESAEPASPPGRRLAAG